MKSFRKISLENALPWMLIVAGTIGLLCSFILTADKIAILQNPNFQPICNLNPVLNCKSVMSSQQSAVLGFQNTFIGLSGFAVILTIGMAMVAGAKFKKWFWQGLQIGLTFGALFVHWLAYNSIYKIGSLCPFCMVVWSVTIPLFLYVTLYNVQERHINPRGFMRKVAHFTRNHHLDLLFAWYALILALILNHFWYYYGPLLGFGK